MEALYVWVRNLACYLIFVTVVINLLPNKIYEKYLRFFFGMILLLLVIQPFTRGLRIEERLSYYFESFSLQNDAEDLQKELLGAEAARLEQMFSRYEEAVAEDIRQLAKTGGFQVPYVKVSLGRDAGSPEYGRVTEVVLVLKTEEYEGMADSGLIDPVRPDVEPIKEVEPVIVGEPETSQSVPDVQEPEPEHAAVRELRTQLHNYYDLEEKDVKIQVQNGSE